MVVYVSFPLVCKSYLENLGRSINVKEKINRTVLVVSYKTERDVSQLHFPVYAWYKCGCTECVAFGK